MNKRSITELYPSFFEANLKGRYVAFSHIENLLSLLKDKNEIVEIGTSVGGIPIHKLKIGTGKKKILMWSQMHGNESTTTKAVFDLLNFLNSKNPEASKILQTCELHIIPILNPDGALAYTRVNKNEVDLNRDAQDKSQPESIILRKIFDEIMPHFCFNLHDQRTIFNVGKTNKPATVSFLSPAEDIDRSITENRKRSMELIAVMNDFLQQEIPGQVGRYDDAFNLNCVGDTFQSLKVPTILFEAGHFSNDYTRDVTRKYIFFALIAGLNYIAKDDIKGIGYEPYFKIPENDKLFYDIILRDVPVRIEEEIESIDIGILFKEVLKNDVIIFEPHIENSGSLQYLYGHKEYTNCSQYITPIKKNDLDNNWVKKNLRIFQ